MKVPEAATLTKQIQDVFKGCKITITTTDQDPAKNRKNAEIFGKAGVRGKWNRPNEEK